MKTMMQRCKVNSRLTMHGRPHFDFNENEYAIHIFDRRRLVFLVCMWISQDFMPDCDSADENLMFCDNLESGSLFNWLQYSG